MAGPTRGATEPTETRWVAHPLAARAIRVAAAVTPLAVSLVVTWLARPYIPHPAGVLGAIIFLAPLALLGVATAMATERLARRMLPLANLLDLSLVFPDRAPSRYSTALRSNTSRQLQRQVTDVQSNRLSTDETEAAMQILALLEALRRHEPLTRGHTERVRAYSYLIGEEMGLSPADLDKLNWAVLLHDIGKLSVPAELLNKEGKPTAEEWEIIKSHPAVGAKMVEPLADWLGEWRHSAGQHHERWDGNGYPNGLATTEISFPGRIVAVADAYDVITSNRSYKSAMSPQAAREELVRCSGSHFDPAVVRAMLSVSVGNMRSIPGRLGWVTHIPAVFQPAASTVAGVAGAAVAVTSTLAPVPLTEPDPPDDLAFAVVEEAAGDAESEGLFIDLAPLTLFPDPDPDAPEVTVPTPSPAPEDAGPFVIVIPTPTPEPSSRPTPTPPSTAIRPEPTAAPDASVDPPAVPVPTTTPTPTPTPVDTFSPPPTPTPTAAPTATPAPTPLPTPTPTPANAQGADCTIAQEGETDLGGADLKNCDLSGADLSHADLSGANLSGADLSEAILAQGVLVRTILVGADLSGANVVKADLSGADLTDTNFQGAILVDADLTDTDIAGIDLAAAKLAMADFTGATGTPANADAQYNRTVCPDGDLTNSGCWG